MCDEMGDPGNEGDDIELPVHIVMLSAYEIGKYEVTNQEYVDVLNWALNHGNPITTGDNGNIFAYGQQILIVTSSYCQISYSGGQFVVALATWNNPSVANHPVVAVTWNGAAVYCNWLSERQGLEPCYDTPPYPSTWECDFTKNGYHLPTEAQWERAAAWDASTQYHHRFANGGSHLGCVNANYNPAGPGNYCDPLDLGTSPVGYYSVSSPVGCYDMSGNVDEWCNDWWYRVYTTGVVTDPTGPSSGLYRVTRGGSWGASASACRSAHRFSSNPLLGDGYLGFRIAR